MVGAHLQQAWVQDLPVCLPGRACVYQSPVAAPLNQATSALTPASALIAAGYLAVTAIALFVVTVCVKQQWRGRGVSGWLVLLIAALLLVGVCTSWAVRGRLAVIAAIYSSTYGQEPVPVPPSLVGAWPVVLASGFAMVASGCLALIAVLVSGLLRRRGDAVA